MCMTLLSKQKYDFQWYVANRVPLNFEHLQKRIREFNGIELSKEDFTAALHEKLSTTEHRICEARCRPFRLQPP